MFSILVHSRAYVLKGLACLRVTPASSHDSSCLTGPGEVLMSPACHACGCVSPFRVPCQMEKTYGTSGTGRLAVELVVGGICLYLFALADVFVR